MNETFETHIEIVETLLCPESAYVAFFYAAVQQFGGRIGPALCTSQHTISAKVLNKSAKVRE